MAGDELLLPREDPGVWEGWGSAGVFLWGAWGHVAGGMGSLMRGQSTSVCSGERAVLNIAAARGLSVLGGVLSVGGKKDGGRLGGWVWERLGGAPPPKQTAAGQQRQSAGVRVQKKQNKKT